MEAGASSNSDEEQDFMNIEGLRLDRPLLPARYFQPGRPWTTTKSPDFDYYLLFKSLLSAVSKQDLLRGKIRSLYWIPGRRIYDLRASLRIAPRPMSIRCDNACCEFFCSGIFSFTSSGVCSEKSLHHRMTGPKLCRPVEGAFRSRGFRFPSGILRVSMENFASR